MYRGRCPTTLSASASTRNESTAVPALFTRVRGRLILRTLHYGVLRSSAKGSSRKFGNLRRLLLFRAHHQHRATSVADNPIGDSPFDGPPYPPVAPATHHDQVRPELLGQAYNLQVHLPHPEVSPGHCAPGSLHSPGLPSEQLAGQLLDLLVELAPRTLACLDSSSAEWVPLRRAPRAALSRYFGPAPRPSGRPALILRRRR